MVDTGVEHDVDDRDDDIWDDDPYDPYDDPDDYDEPFCGRCNDSRSVRRSCFSPLRHVQRWRYASCALCSPSRVQLVLWTISPVVIARRTARWWRWRRAVRSSTVGYDEPPF